LRAISKRRIDSREERTLVKQAKEADRASKLARREAKTHQAMVGAAFNLETETPVAETAGAETVEVPVAGTAEAAVVETKDVAAE
jgi:hypothetical protein